MGLFLLISACHPTVSADQPPVSAPPAATPAVPQTAGSTSGTLVGPCESSALVWDGQRWLVADNEINDHLFAFDANFQPVGTVPVTPPVEDMEALAVDGGRVLVIGSASQKKGGETALNRRKVVEIGKGEIQIPWDSCAGCGLGLSPEGGGLNIEGAAWWNGALWFGFRSPVPGGKTTLWSPGSPLRQMEWDGSGVRDLAVRGGELLLLLGPSLKEDRPYQLATLSQGPPGLRLPEDSEGLGVGPDGKLVVVTDGGWEKGMGGCKSPSTWTRLEETPPRP